METYLKNPPFENHYPECIPNLPLGAWPGFEPMLPERMLFHYTTAAIFVS